MMEPKHTRPEDSKTQVESSIGEDRLEGLLHPTSQPTSVEKAADEPVFECKGDFIRNLKVATWTIAGLFILCFWLGSFALTFIGYRSDSFSMTMSAIALACAIAMQFKKEKSWVKVYSDRIEWSSQTLDQLALKQGSVDSPYAIHVWAGFVGPAIKSPDGKLLGRLPMLQWADLIRLVAAARKRNIPVAINVFRPFNQQKDGYLFAEANHFTPLRLFALALPFLGVAWTFSLFRSEETPLTIALLPMIVGIMVSLPIQLYLTFRRKGRTGLLFGKDVIFRIKSDEVIWSLTASDIRHFEYKANMFFLQVFAVTQYGRRHEINMAPSEALRFAVDNGIPFIQRGESSGTDKT